MTEKRIISLDTDGQLEVEFTKKFEDLVRHHLQMEKDQVITESDIKKTIYNCFSSAIKKGLAIDKDTQSPE